MSLRTRPVPLLARVAEHLYWGSRYLERAVGTSRLVRAYSESLVDLPTSVSSSWEPLLAITGMQREAVAAPAGDEHAIFQLIVADQGNPGSIVSSVLQARANLSTVREVLPETMWRIVNDLSLYVRSDETMGVRRRSRARFFERVIADGERMDGVRTATMLRDATYELVRMGQAVERADVTTRVLGVRAADLLAGGPMDAHGEVQWMGVLRCLAAFQAYHRAVRAPISADAVIGFVLFERAFPRSVEACLARVRQAAASLPPDREVDERCLDAVRALASLDVDGRDPAALDAAMDRLQLAIASLHDAIGAAYFLRRD